jgi:hypothetical protein
MAAHIASTLLHTHRTPWLSAKWSKNDIHSLADVDSQCLCCSYPFVTRKFLSNEGEGEEGGFPDDAAAEVPNYRFQPSEEDTRACLFVVGVMILELVFGHSIEKCRFRRDYYGKDGKPNDQTDVSTARKWATKVLGESGANIADVVRRCLDCSFGPRPIFSDVRFREAVYDGVIKPLATYSRVWPEVMS